MVFGRHTPLPGRPPVWDFLRQRVLESGVNMAGEVAHELKAWPKPFRAMAAGNKHHEIRQDDGRNFRPGHVLRLREWLPSGECYTGREMLVKVTHIDRDRWGLPDGLVVMSIERMHPAPYEAS